MATTQATAVIQFQPPDWYYRPIPIVHGYLQQCAVVAQNSRQPCVGPDRTGGNRRRTSVRRRACYPCKGMGASAARLYEMTTINIIFHSVTGHTFRLAEALGEGVSAIKGCRPQLKRIPEPAGADPITMSGLDETVHNYLHIPEAVVEDLVHCDGIALGFSVYWGNMNYAMKHFLDSAAKLWSFASPDKPVTAATELIGKPATVFTGGGTGLGNDAAILGMWTALGFFGMTIVTLGLNVPEISDPSRVGGGSPLGAGTFSRRPGVRPSVAEMSIARAQGRALAETSRAWAQRPSG